MEPQIIKLQEKKLVGMHLPMSIADNKTFKLWSTFKSRVHEIGNRCSSDFISMQLYEPFYFTNFNPSTPFIKWAAVEVSNCDKIPNDLECFTLEGGTYAVFFYKGSSADTSIFQYIFGEWLPNSGYQLGDRPHFEVLGSKYKNNDPTSEEEIWIPITKK